MPELNENYVNNSVMFPRGNTYARGKVMGQKREADGNSFGRNSNKSILDMRKYCDEFDYRKVRKLTKM